MTLERSEVLEDPSAKQGTSRRVEGRVLAPVEVWTASSAGVTEVLAPSRVFQIRGGLTTATRPRRQ